MHREFVNPVQWQHTYSGGYQSRKEINYCIPCSIALNKLRFALWT